ncbi:hypothetical protein N7520_008002 [Penicillium odoratum]|uniref:uncharacterized protein n=1 Tax=Penicillium odoratum TaxID=1167516 RepID=UPI002548394D|nr:uncharacterized protein N7520_008002 [Penicillium odoratum]KAJ5760846.1 hypothetical protein N7520_008002 [Penicillium odoratum]
MFGTAVWEKKLALLPRNIATGQADTVDEKGFASIGDSVSPMTLCVQHAQAQRLIARSKNENNQCVSRRKLSEIKLKRTDTTLDLSQLAKRAGKEKRKEEMEEGGRRYLYPQAEDASGNLAYFNQP